MLGQLVTFDREDVELLPGDLGSTGRPILEPGQLAADVLAMQRHPDRDSAIVERAQPCSSALRFSKLFSIQSRPGPRSAVRCGRRRDPLGRVSSSPENQVRRSQSTRHRPGRLVWLRAHELQRSFDLIVRISSLRTKATSRLNGPLGGAPSYQLYEELPRGRRPLPWPAWRCQLAAKATGPRPAFAT